MSARRVGKTEVAAYHWLRPDDRVGAGLRVGAPEVLGAVDLRRGAWLGSTPALAAALPLVFTLEPEKAGKGEKGAGAAASAASVAPAGASLPHWIGDRVPLVSELLISTLRRAGVDNFQTLPAVVRGGPGTAPWTGHSVFNVIGAVDAADPEASVGTVLVEEDPGPKLVEYAELVLTRARTRDLDMFRLADSPNMLLVHDRVMRVLADRTPDDGWGFTAIEIELR